MRRTAVLVMFLCLATRAGFACTTEEALTASLQARAAGVQVEHRFDALHAQKFFELFARVTEVSHPPRVDRVMIYATPGTSMHTVVAFFAGCLLGHGTLTGDAYRAILDQLRLAMSL